VLVVNEVTVKEVAEVDVKVRVWGVTVVMVPVKVV
jgi:hypothetical protein